MKRNRESQYRIKLIQEMYLNKEDQRVLEEAIHDAKITFSKIYRIGIHRTVDVNKLVEFIKRYGEHCKVLQKTHNSGFDLLTHYLLLFI